MTPFRPVVLVPVYDHEGAIGAMVDAILAHPLPCLLVDDGSSPACEQVLREIAAAHPERVRLIRLSVNQGKGGAIMAGFTEAARLGYTHALQIDADGQHDAGCIPQFTALAQAQPAAMICGHPVYDDSVPRLRLYPLAAVTALMRDVDLGRRMEFDTEVLVHLVWRGVRIVNVPTRVTYPSDGVSHFQAWRDNVLISRMHTRLFFGMVWRLPRLLWRRVRPA
jgi:glycosyltransferase involved in cell wall biosynthesis